MMKEISLNLLDISENSIKAEASLIEIRLHTSLEKDLIFMQVVDNGKGMSKDTMQKSIDPFYSTRTTRKIGFGLPFLKLAAELTGGFFRMESQEGEGTTVEAGFKLSSVDRMPLGDISGTIHALILGNSAIDFVFRYGYEEREFELDTRKMRNILQGIPFYAPEVSKFIRDYLEENIAEINGKVDL